MIRNFAIPTITRAQALEGIKDWNVLPFALVSTFCLVQLAVRWFWYFDFIGLAAFAVGCVICGWSFALNLEDSKGIKPSDAFKLKNRIIRQALLLVPMLALVIVCGGGNDGYRFNYATGQSTLTRSMLFISPFGEQPVFYVYRSQSNNVDIEVLTKDGVPLRCHVIANGISLDVNDTQKLEAMIFNLDPATEPQTQIASAVIGSLSSSAVRVLSSKTSAEAGQEKTLLIQYSIGSPLGDTFQRYMLKWSRNGGSVSYSCQVRFS